MRIKCEMMCLKCSECQECIPVALIDTVFGGVSLRLPGDSRGIPCPGNRRASSAAAQGGPSDECYEHQAGARPEDLCSHQHAQGLLGLARVARILAQDASSQLSRARQTFLRGPDMGPVGGQGLSPWGVAGDEVLAPPPWLSGAFLSVGGAER